MSQNNQESKAKNLIENTLEEVLADIFGAFTIIRNPCEVEILAQENVKSAKEDLINRIVNKVRVEILGAIELDIGEMEKILLDTEMTLQTKIVMNKYTDLAEAIASAKDKIVRVR